MWPFWLKRPTLPGFFYGPWPGQAGEGRDAPPWRSSVTVSWRASTIGGRPLSAPEAFNGGPWYCFGIPPAAYCFGIRPSANAPRLGAVHEFGRGPRITVHCEDCYAAGPSRYYHISDGPSLSATEGWAVGSSFLPAAVLCKGRGAQKFARPLG